MGGLTVIAPGLLGPGADKLGVAADSELELPALSRILAKADTSAFPWLSYEAALCGLFGIPGPELPVAAISYLYDFIDNNNSHWIRADPVYLRADLHKLILFDGDFLALTPDEAQALAGELSNALCEDLAGLRISTDAKRWYLPVAEPPRLLTQPVSAVMGQDVRGLLPSGEDQGRWLRLGNEIQMVLHAATVNQEREARRQIPANSLWFWGVGALPSASAQCPWSAVFSDDPLALGLARWSGVPGYGGGVSGVQPPSPPLRLGSGQPSPCQGEGAEKRNPAVSTMANSSVPMQAAGVLAALAGLDKGEALVVLPNALRPSRYSDIAGWQEVMSVLERDWFAPLLKAVQQGELAHLRVIADGCDFTLKRNYLWQFWRRGRALHEYQPGESG